MIQIAIVACAVLLIAIGIKGFTKDGLALSPKKTLRGPSGRLVGAICIFAGLALIPAFFAFTWFLSR